MNHDKKVIEFNRMHAILVRLELERVSKMIFPDDYLTIQESIVSIQKYLETSRLKDINYYKFLKDLLKSYRATGKEDATDVESMEVVMKEDFKRVKGRLMDWKNYLEKEFEIGN